MIIDDFKPSENCHQAILGNILKIEFQLLSNQVKITSMEKMAFSQNVEMNNRGLFKMLTELAKHEFLLTNSPYGTREFQDLN